MNIHVPITIIIVVVLGLGIYQQSVSAYYIGTTSNPWSYDKIKDGILTYKIESNDKIFKTLVKNAFSEWQKKLKYLSFKEITGTHSWFDINIGNNFIDITVKQVSSLKPYSKHGDTAGFAEHEYDGIFKTGSNIYILEDAWSDEHKQSTIMHEIGHALGLKHTNDETSLMNGAGTFLFPIVSDCDAYFVFIANDMSEEKYTEGAKEDGCDLVYEYDETEGSIQYVITSSPVMFKIKYPANLKISPNRSPFELFKLYETSPISNQTTNFFMRISGEISPKTNETQITFENFEEVYSDYITSFIKKNYPNHTIHESQITLLKNNKIHKMITEKDNFKIIVIRLPNPVYDILFEIACLYDKNKESYFLPICDKILDSLELIVQINLAERSDLAYSNQLNSTTITSYEIDELFKKADTFFNEKNYDKALEYYDKIFSQVPLHIGAINSLSVKGLVLLEKQRYDKALQYYDKILEIDPNHVDALNKKAFALANIGKYEEALALIERVLDSNSNNENYLSTAALIMYNLEKYQKAKNYFDKALHINPNLTEILTEKELIAFNELMPNNNMQQTS